MTQKDEEKLFELEQQLDIPYKDRYYNKDDKRNYEAKQSVINCNIPCVNIRLFGVYDRNGNIKSVYKEPYNAFEEAIKLNRQLVKDEYFIGWVIVG